MARKARRQYQFVATDGNAVIGYNKLYVQAFVDAMNAHDFVRHNLAEKPEDRSLVFEQGWSYGIPPRYNDGRITTRRTAWVYAKTTEGGNDEHLADVYFTGANYFVSIGYLRLLPSPDAPTFVNQWDVCPTEQQLADRKELEEVLAKVKAEVEADRAAGKIK